ncbi:MAG: RluA family pseudouridine synthase [Lachnospiraceae bacterium]|nr:RluA family pseudouridine synthase [uncultured Acetatifactor sp.]MCI8287619.1 RluA family pseudouridine synthase [Lachnospiraceae bacterium]
MHSCKVAKNQAGQRLDKFLHKLLPAAGSGFLYKMLRKKNITLNGKRAQGNEVLVLNDEVTLFFSDETFAKFSGQLPASGQTSETEPTLQKGRVSSQVREYENAFAGLQGITILYEDDDYLIVNKPCGILTQKAVSTDVSLNEWLTGYLLQKNPAFGEELSAFHPSVCNRLDRNTSGIVLCGKSLPGLQYLSSIIRERRIRKFYRTICVGALKKAVTMQGYLVKKSAENRVTVSRTPPSAASGEKASPIHTVCSPILVTDAFTLLEVELVTGKSHQIRAHLAEIGHPLAGDYKYGKVAVNRLLKEKYGLEHHLLHACRVTFPENLSEPGNFLSGKNICAPCPALFTELEDKLFGR